MKTGMKVRYRGNSKTAYVPSILYTIEEVEDEQYVIISANGRKYRCTASKLEVAS